MKQAGVFRKLGGTAEITVFVLYKDKGFLFCPKYDTAVISDKLNTSYSIYSGIDNFYRKG